MGNVVEMGSTVAVKLITGPGGASLGAVMVTIVGETHGPTYS